MEDWEKRALAEWNKYIKGDIYNLEQENQSLRSQLATLTAENARLRGQVEGMRQLLQRGIQGEASRAGTAPYVNPVWKEEVESLLTSAPNSTKIGSLKVDFKTGEVSTFDLEGKKDEPLTAPSEFVTVRREDLEGRRR